MFSPKFNLNFRLTFIATLAAIIIIDGREVVDSITVNYWHSQSFGSRQRKRIESHNEIEEKK